MGRVFMYLKTIAFRFVFLLFCGTAATGCASVKISIPGTEKAEATSTERVALKDAASSLSDHPWGESPENGFVSVLFGTVANNEKERVVKAYISEMESRGEDAVTGVFADADMSLAHARQVVEAGRQALNAINPQPSDIALLERAISDTRECRAMYVAVLETLDRRNAGVTREDVRVIRDAFSQTIDDMGVTADLVAEHVAMTQDRARYADRTAYQPAVLSESGQ